MTKQQILDQNMNFTLPNSIINQIRYRFHIINQQLLFNIHKTHNFFTLTTNN